MACTIVALTIALSAAAGAWAGWWNGHFRALGLEPPTILAAILAMLTVLPIALAVFRRVPPTKGAWLTATIVSSLAYAGVMSVFLVLILGPSNTPDVRFGWLLVVPFVFGPLAWLVRRQHVLPLAMVCLLGSAIIPTVTKPPISVGLQKWITGEPEEVERYLRREKEWDLPHNAPRAVEALSWVGIVLGSSAAIASAWRMSRRRRFE